MLDLSKKNGKALPESIIVNGKVFPIYTDFQTFILFTRMIKEQHPLKDFDFIYKSAVPHYRQLAFLELLKFAFPVNELPRNPDKNEDSTILLDYEVDADLIYAAFYHYYHIDLLDANLHLHWYSFLSLLNSIKDTRLNDIMNYRAYKPGKNDPQEYKNNMLKAKEMWKINKELSTTEIDAVEEFDRKNGIK